jgi:hypothetical protein
MIPHRISWVTIGQGMPRKGAASFAYDNTFKYITYYILLNNTVTIK